MDFVVLGVFLLGVVFLMTLRTADIQVDRALIVWSGVSLALPLLALWTFLASALHRGNWWPFQRESSVSHLLAAAAFVLIMLKGLRDTAASTKTKALIGVSWSLLWVGLWFVGTLFVVCATGIAYD